MVVCFIGHRTVSNIEQVKIKLINVVTNLVLSGVDTFLFGSRSEFNYLCWDVVTSLQEQFSNIKRICYNAPHEAAFTSKEEREYYEHLCYKMLNYKVHYENYETAIHSPKLHNANKNTYIIRNEEMIDNSDICVFYYNKDYLPPKRKKSKNDMLDYQPKSGTAIAFKYALSKKKQIINVFIQEKTRQ